jgi:hypothetical protein
MPYHAVTTSARSVERVRNEYERMKDSQPSSAGTHSAKDHYLRIEGLAVKG